jgi:hypothetical protein
MSFWILSAIHEPEALWLFPMILGLCWAMLNKLEAFFMTGLFDEG